MRWLIGIAGVAAACWFAPQQDKPQQDKPQQDKPQQDKPKQDKTKQDKLEFAPNRPDEPFAEQFSLQRAVGFMDSAARMWNTKYRCVTCHTNGLYLAARASIPRRGKAYAETRALAKGYLESYVVEQKKPKGQRGAIEGIVATTSFLAISDMATTGRLDDVTRKGLDTVFAAQDDDGAWGKWLKCGWPPYEIDDHFGVTLAALALGHAPPKYRRSRIGKAGLGRLRRYLRAEPATVPHHKGMLLWVAAKLDGVVAAKTRQRWCEELIGLQRKDGGWRLVDLGGGLWKRKKDAAAELPSDAYATGFTIFVLRRAGVPAKDPRVQRGLAWLRKNQRRSGRWFVRSPKRDGKHFLSHAATQFAVLALISCQEQRKAK